jgi:hypothetical protein
VLGGLDFEVLAKVGGGSHGVCEEGNARPHRVVTSSVGFTFPAQPPQEPS